ncbi:MAG: hypothetical protein KatS3mg013_2184 [Actinomycetota bacterium]|jgi:hypothetical protein|nr:MAG: hypothetical protein KatS3mg013_2184 [Actinomycetota bacterium]
MDDVLWIGVAAALLGAVGGAALATALARRPAQPDVGGLEARLELQAAELRRLADAAAQRDLSAEHLRGSLEAARRTLEELSVREQERRARDDEHRDVIRRLTTVLAGGSATGRAGEHVLREHLAHLPPTMLEQGFRVNGKIVEFGLLLPDGRRLPIDSKWTARAELEALERAENPVERDACARAVERAVVVRAREVAQYLDPSVTAPVAIAAVPDAAYAALRRAHADAFGKGVVIVPYSSALPIALFLYALVQRLGAASDVQATLVELAAVLDALETLVENRFVRAERMLAGGVEEARSHLGRARGSIARARAADPGAVGPDGDPVVPAGPTSAFDAGRGPELAAM